MVIGKIGQVPRKKGDVNPFSNATRMAVFAPVLAILAVGVRARYYPDTVEPWHANPAAQERVVAFGEVLNQTADVIALPVGEASVGKVREAAQVWIDGAAQGRLRPLHPAFYVDTTMEGPKIEIERAVARLSSTLMAHSDKALAAGKPDEAIHNASLAYQVSEVLRTSDLIAAATGSSRERRAMLILAAALPKSSPAGQAEAEKALTQPRESLQPVVEITMNQRDIWMERYKQPKTSDGVRNYLNGLLREKPTNFAARAGELKQELGKRDGAKDSDVLFNAGRAVANEWMFQDGREKASAALEAAKK